jgi:hypothetical protein
MSNHLLLQPAIVHFLAAKEKKKPKLIGGKPDQSQFIDECVWISVYTSPLLEVHS